MESPVLEEGVECRACGNRFSVWDEDILSAVFKAKFVNQQ